MGSVLKIYKRLLAYFDRAHATKAERFGGQLAGCTVAMWGLAFPPETDNVRVASGCIQVADLLASGAHVRAYTTPWPYQRSSLLAVRLSLAEMDSPTQATHADEALAGADGLALATEWKEFSSQDAGP